MSAPEWWWRLVGVKHVWMASWLEWGTGGSPGTPRVRARGVAPRRRGARAAGSRRPPIPRMCTLPIPTTHNSAPHRRASARSTRARGHTGHTRRARTVLHRCAAVPVDRPERCACARRSMGTAAAQQLSSFWHNTDIEALGVRYRSIYTDVMCMSSRTSSSTIKWPSFGLAHHLFSGSCV